MSFSEMPLPFGIHFSHGPLLWLGSQREGGRGFGQSPGAAQGQTSGDESLGMRHTNEVRKTPIGITMMSIYYIITGAWCASWHTPCLRSWYRETTYAIRELNSPHRISTQAREGGGWGGVSLRVYFLGVRFSRNQNTQACQVPHLSLP